MKSALSLVDETFMVRSVVSLLAVLPLLLPPGMCVCHASTAACSPLTVGHHDHHAGLAHLCLAHTHEHGPSGPADREHQHTSSCPVAKILSLPPVESWFLPGGTLVALVAGWHLLGGTNFPALVSAAESPDQASAEPLYLTFLTLLL